MANPIQHILNTVIKELSSAEASKTAAELAKTLKELGLENTNLLLDILNSPFGQVVRAGVPLIGSAVKILEFFIKITKHNPTFPECIFFISQVAYLESLKEFLKKNDSLLNRIERSEQTRIPEGVKPLLKQLEKLEFSEEAAEDTFLCFRDSILAKEFNNVLLKRLQPALNPSEAQILTKRVAANTHRYLIKAWAVSGDAIKHFAQPSISERREELLKYHSIDKYLQEQIADKPEEKVFAEEFKFKDIYVPLKAKPIDKNGAVIKKEPVDLADWAEKLLEDKNKQNRVMFIEASPGRGKSVFCRMFADWVRQNLHPVWTPVFIRLRDITKLHDNFLETLKDAVNADFALDNHWLTDRNTRYLFFLDGFDELQMQGRSSGGLDKFLTQVGKFQRDCNRNSAMGHRVLITGRTLALQELKSKREMPNNLERVEIQMMDNQLQKQWLEKWEAQFGAETTSAFQQFLQDQRCPEQVKSDLAREPLLLYLLAAMHRDEKLKVEDFQGASGTQAKILIYNQAVDWVLTEQRCDLDNPNLNLKLTEFETEDLRCILTEAGLCVVQSGGECTPVAMIEERLKENNRVKVLLEKAHQRIGEDFLRNALASFYLQPGGSKEGSVEFVHKSFGEFLCAERLKESLENWTIREEIGGGFNTKESHMNWEIYDLLGYGGLTEEILEYLIGLLTAQSGATKKNQCVQLFQRLENFYMQWCDQKFINAPPSENWPQRKMCELQEQLKRQELGLVQIDTYAGLNVMILLFELHRYGQDSDKLKNKMVFYPCGKPNAEGKLDDPSQLFRIIGYSCCVGYDGFLQTVGRFLSGANLSGADLSRANLSGADLSNVDLSRANLSGANLSRANLGGADLSGADLSRAILSGANLSGADLSNTNLSNANLSGANLGGADLGGADLGNANFSNAKLWCRDFEYIQYDENTKWKNIRGLNTAIHVPKGLSKLLTGK